MLLYRAADFLFHSPSEANTVVVLQKASGSLLLMVTPDLDSIMEGVNLSSSKYHCSHGEKK